MGYYTYILYSESFDRFYYGQTANLSERLNYHNSKKVKSTSKYTPWKIYAFKESYSRSEAMKFERMLKNLKSRQKVSMFIERHDFKLV